MTKMQMIHDFAEKWRNKFNDANVDYIELVDHYMADDCEQLGFEMDCGQAFGKNYGEAFGRSEELEKVINDITDIPLLGSAIYSKWRYFNHWAYSGDEILQPENRRWFVMVFKRMAELSEDNT